MNDRNSEDASATAGSFPEPIVENRLSRRRAALAKSIWLIPLGCLLVAILLIAINTTTQGTVIYIHFEKGHGIKPGDTLRHRGVEVGEVTGVKMKEDLQGVTVEVELDPKASNLARVESQFWIVRPQVSLTAIRGLETVVGAKYLGVLPGPVDGDRQTVFNGVESPLMMLDSEVVEITIRFHEGHGLAVGDPVKYRGISIGEVTDVRLDGELTNVFVQVRLSKNATRVAKAGSQFWIERPDVSLAGIRGLDTVIGGRYIGVIPAPAEAAPLLEFDGLEAAPPTIEQESQGLEIVLECTQRNGLKRGIPVSYRGVAIGQVLSVGLSNDSIAVEARVYVRPEYRQLIRDNTVFWNNSGIDFRVGLRGIEVDADALSSIALGSVAIATPDPPGRTVSTGHRFDFYEELDEDWLAWRPRIPVTSALIPDGLSLPSPQLAALHWKTRTLGVTRNHERAGWVLVLGDGRILGPTNLFDPGEKALDGETLLSISNEEIPIQPAKVQAMDEISVYRTLNRRLATERAWPLTRTRTPSRVESVLLTTASHEKRLPVAASRITMEENGWAIDPSLAIDSSWHGASVISVEDGSLIGVLQIDDDSRHIALIPTILKQR